MCRPLPFKAFTILRKFGGVGVYPVYVCVCMCVCDVRGGRARCDRTKLSLVYRSHTIFFLLLQAQSVTWSCTVRDRGRAPF